MFWEKKEKSSCKPCLFKSSPSKKPVENSLAMFMGSKFNKKGQMINRQEKHLLKEIVNSNKYIVTCKYSPKT